MTGELGRLVGGLNKCLDLSSGDGAGEGRLLDLFLFPVDEVGQGSGRKIQLGGNPGANTVVTILISISQLQKWFTAKRRS